MHLKGYELITETLDVHSVAVTDSLLRGALVREVGFHVTPKPEEDESVRFVTVQVRSDEFARTDQDRPSEQDIEHALAEINKRSLSERRRLDLPPESSWLLNILDQAGLYHREGMPVESDDRPCLKLIDVDHERRRYTFEDLKSA